MGQIVTFYSYKGGVGRTMALANVSILLARWGYSTLVVDWDLEAPGLENFFGNFLQPAAIAAKTGVVDLLDSVSEVEGLQGQALDWRKMFTSMSVPDAPKPIHLLSAGKRTDGYFGKLRKFDIDTFYLEKEGGQFIETLRSDWKTAYDFVLIDSRTGITDIGGICTIQLPDILILLFTATAQGFEGVVDVARRASEARQKLPVDRLSLLCVPIPSRFDAQKEFETSNSWMERFATDLSGIYSEWLPKNVERLAFLNATKIPYIPYFSFGEKLAVIEQGTSDPSGLGYAYQTLASIIGNNLERVDQLLDNRSEFVRAASRVVQMEPSLDAENKTREPTVSTPTFNFDAYNSHIKWLDSYGKEGTRLDLTKAILKRIVIKDAKLAQAILVEADLSGANLEKADLSSSVLKGANLRDALLSHANLREAELQNSNLLRANLQGASLIEARLNGSDLARANLTEADLSEVNLGKTNLTNTNMQGANLKEADFGENSLKTALLKNANLQYANLEHTSDLLEEQLAGTNLKGAKLPYDVRNFTKLEELRQKALGLRVRRILMLLMCAATLLMWFIKFTNPALLSYGSTILIIFGIPLSTVAFYFYFHPYLQTICAEIPALPKIFPDGVALYKKIVPSFLSSIVLLHSEGVTGNVLPTQIFQSRASVFLTWYAVPLTMFIGVLIVLAMSSTVEVYYRTYYWGSFFLSFLSLASVWWARLFSRYTRNLLLDKSSLE
jgi:uncharacterized protein YjbI with pentapeptide repeats